VLLRLLMGRAGVARVGLSAALAAMVLGTGAGHSSPWLDAAGWLDAALMRLADGLLALPALPLLVFLAALDPAAIGLPRGEPAADMLRIAGLLAAFGWVGVARLVRATALSVLARDFVRAARAMGVGEARILARMSCRSSPRPSPSPPRWPWVARCLAESTLSFLGLGIAPPAPSWGNMLANAQELVFQAPWLRSGRGWRSCSPSWPATWWRTGVRRPRGG
jgi:peptide/nickel transport system permease protein